MRPRLASLGRRGQIVIPALFMFPTLMLFVFLLFETAKVSRYKIRHQFAVDAAAFVEMTNYSDFLNRTAYVNGAFPMRIFREGFHDTPEDCRGKDPCPAPGYDAQGNLAMIDDIMYHDGDFPRDEQNPDGYTSPSPPQWNIQFNPSSSRSGMNDPNDMNVFNPSGETGNPPCSSPCTLIFNIDTVTHWNIGWDDANQVFKLYVQIYQLLGSVEAAQYAVLDRLQQSHNFLSKSYYLNIGDQTALAEAQAAVQDFNMSAGGFMGAINLWCTPRMRIMGYIPMHDLEATGITSQDAQMPTTITCYNTPYAGLFQATTIKQTMLDSMWSPSSDGRPFAKGWPVTVHWTAPSNYFGVDLNAIMQSADNGGPKVHASVSIWNGGPAGTGLASIWPLPTPKFQTRLYP